MKCESFLGGAFWKFIRNACYWFHVLRRITPNFPIDMGPYIAMYLEQVKKDSSVNGWGVWFVILKENDQVIGDMGFKGKPDEQKRVEIGYGILPTARNKGFATEAVQGLLDWAFSSGQVEKVTAECSKDNVASNCNGCPSRQPLFLFR